MPENYNPNSQYQDPLQPDPMPPSSGPTTHEYYNPNSQYQDPLQPDPMPPSSGPTTCPDIVGVTTISVLSCKGTSNCALTWRVGDTQPRIDLQMLDGNGDAITLAGAIVTFRVVIPGQQSFVQSSEMTIGGDGVTLTYERGVNDFTTLNAGRYYFSVNALFGDGTGITGPDGSESVLVVNSQW